MMRPYLRYSLLVALFVLLQACSSRVLTPLENDATILAFGDSLTAGVGVGIDESYPSVLAELSGRRVVNSGISGETTDRGLKRLPAVLTKVAPDLMILIEGGNDILRNQSHAELKNNLKQMIELAKAQDVQVVLIGVPEKSLFSNSAPLYKELAEEYQLVFDDSLLAGLLRSPSKKSDSVHFNAEGYRDLASAIYSLLKDKGAL